MVDLIVVGAGVAGSSVARHALAAGLNPIVVGSAYDRASDNALCVMRAGWFDKDGLRTEARYAAAYYRDCGAMVAETGLVSRAGKEPKLQADYFGIDPWKPLVTPDVEARVVEVGDGSVTLDTGEKLAGAAVALCAGVGNVELAGYAPKELLWGSTGVFVNAFLPHPVRVHHFGPYSNIMAAQVGITVRIGSSKAPNPEQARERLVAMVNKAREAGMLDGMPDDYSITTGRRVMPSGEPATVRRVSDRVWTLAGLGRVGYALSPARGQQLVAQVQAAL